MAIPLPNRRREHGPGGEVDLKVRADLRAPTHVWMGDFPLARALQSGAIALEGPRELVRAFPGRLAFSPPAGLPRPPAARLAG